MLDVGDQLVDRGFDALEHGPRVDPEEQDPGQEREHHEDLPRGHVLHLGVVTLDRAVEHPLVGPEQVHGGEDDAGRGDHRPPLAGQERADEDQELADEPVQPGQADRAEHDHQEDEGHDRGDLLEAAELGDLPGVAALVDHPDEEEQGAGREAVVDHLQDRALQALGREGEGAEHDEAEVGHRRVGDQPLEVLLHRGHDRGVDDADHPEGDHEGGEVDRRFGEQVEAEAQEPVGPELQHDAGQDHRARRRGLGVGVGQPGVEREQRRLDREGQGEGQEDPSAGVDREGLALGQRDQVEGDRVARLPGGQDDQGQDADQHQGRAQHRVEEELEGGVHLAPVAPAPDQEVHRDQDDLEHDEEDEEVQGQERPQAAGLEQQQPGVVRLGVVARVGRQHGDREQAQGHHHEEERDPVDAEVPRDPEVGDPLLVVDELEAALAELVLDQHPAAHGRGGERRQDRDGLDQLLAGPREAGHEQGARRGQEHQDAQDGEPVVAAHSDTRVST